MSDYSVSAPLFLPRTLLDAEFASRSVLGPLIDHDRDNGTDLVGTLETFLDCDRSWAAAAQRLHVHKQTLGYRLRRIESLTGRSPQRSADIAMFWMALLARRISQGD
ncbi:PucR family transcriptional regulator [Saccharopolyspora erythraea]|uniref:Regulatory protein n=2 Tax=Saccharopolyspora erythraea TaxID=1836 RepID=A4FD44_SACEN|nr:helix-turn-helix domain-containing protein [Saccharopolyspora erythraea]EQD86268.1 PucR family transcriptional regulator [Saccharopolyspora erythraea D]QRK92310.1 helix-turn-helix domain-containing protein [Saccharopolyspora erythraea]CAM01969.1 putative regulatory protein [Saccharopolyspora erythraea NRRL 2338]